jgi:ankyrin repeat protein
MVIIFASLPTHTKNSSSNLGITGKRSRTMNTASSKIVLDPVAFLLGLIESEDWNMIRKLIALSSPDCFRAMASSIPSISEPDFNGTTLLHAIVRHNPPLDIVGNIIRLCPDLPASRDDLGWTPLHVAACSKASPLLLKFLACAYPAACDAQDEEGKTPLHFVCEPTLVLFGGDTSSTPQEAPNHEAVVALLSESMNAATIEDDEDMTPLEHAIMNGASLNTIKLLQSSSAKCLRSRALSTSTSPDPETNKKRRVSGAF